MYNGNYEVASLVYIYIYMYMYVQKRYFPLCSIVGSLGGTSVPCHVNLPTLFHSLIPRIDCAWSTPVL